MIYNDNNYKFILNLIASTTATEIAKIITLPICTT